MAFVIVIEGDTGTGKTTAANALRNGYEMAGFDVVSIDDDRIDTINSDARACVIYEESGNYNIPNSEAYDRVVALLENGFGLIDVDCQANGAWISINNKDIQDE